MAKHYLYNFFSKSGNKNDKGVTKKEAKFDGKYNFANFFKFYKRNFNTMTKANLMYALLCVPLVFMILPFSGIYNTEAFMPTNMIYPVVQGMAQYGGSAVIDAYTAIYGGTTAVSVWSDTSYILFYCGGAVALTFGFANVGMAYITRNIVRRKHVFPWSDFFSAIKKNFKQALFVGLFDFIVILLLIYDVFAYSNNDGDFIFRMFFFVIIVVAICWSIMRAYIYPLIVTFDLSFYKLLKNSLIFTMLGIKRNFWILLGLVAAFFFTFYSVFILPTVGYMFPFILTIGFVSFLMTWCAWPIIDEYMIKPYYPDADSDSYDDDDEEYEEEVFADRG